MTSHNFKDIVMHQDSPTARPSEALARQIHAK